MKITKDNVKKHARKIQHASESEFKEFQEGYAKLLGNIRGIDTPMLLVVSVIGIAIILLFQNGILDFIGLVVLIYPFYLFARREGHQEGYYEGYYDRMTKGTKENNMEGNTKEPGDEK